jgi:hypothetical protein
MADEDDDWENGDAYNSAGPWKCGITGRDCPADPEQTKNCPKC